MTFKPGDLWSDIVLAIIAGLSKVGCAGVAKICRVAAEGVEKDVEEIVTRVECSTTSAFVPSDLRLHMGNATDPSVER